MTKNTVLKKLGSAALALLVAAAGALPYILFRDQIQSMSTLGYAGLFIACMLTNASLFLPASGIAFTLAAATALDPLLCALIGGLGTACGELVGYTLGRCGRSTIDKPELFDKIDGYLLKYGYAAVFAFAFFPLPLFDLVGVAAGTAKLNVLKFFIVCTAGKILKMLLYVFLIGPMMQL